MRSRRRQTHTQARNVTIALLAADIVQTRYYMQKNVSHFALIFSVLLLGRISFRWHFQFSVAKCVCVCVYSWIYPSIYPSRHTCHFHVLCSSILPHSHLTSLYTHTRSLDFSHFHLPLNISSSLFVVDVFLRLDSCCVTKCVPLKCLYFSIDRR